MAKKPKLLLSLAVILVISFSVTLFLITKSSPPTKEPRPLISVFPLKNYDQNINTWINPTDPGYNKTLITHSNQQKNLKDFYNHLYGPLSPWDKDFIEKRLNGHDIDPLTKHIDKQKIIESYANLSEDPRKIGHGVNFRPYDKTWLDKIMYNMNLEQFSLPIKFMPINRAITIKNTLLRSLPTNDPFFLHHSLAGEGYPFDLLQDSAEWVGTPIYIIGKTLDQKWSLILSPSYLAWIESNSHAKTSPTFITLWREHAKKNMAAITKTNISISDTNNQHRFNTYIGTVFPVKSFDEDSITTLIPTANNFHYAEISHTKVSTEDATIMPLAPTPKSFAKIISSLISRPYGWGNMYFYNDCSAELKSLYTPFGIWLPRNSPQQASGREIIDLSDKGVEERLKYLIENGKKFITLIHVNGHIMMYVGHLPNTKNQEPMVMTYQNIWGLAPKDNSYRAVIGKSLFFPLSKSYPEDDNLHSWLNNKVFRLFYLNFSPS